MDEITAYKKKITIYVALALIIGTLINIIGNAINFIMPVNYEEAASQTTDIFTTALNLVLIIATIGVYFLSGYLLTKNFRKTVVFVGTLYFASAVTSLVSQLLISAVRIFANSNLSYTDLSAKVIVVIETIFVLADIFVACFVFTAFEGINNKFQCENISTSVMTLSRARKRYIIAFLLNTLLSGAVSMISLFVVNLFINQLNTASLLATNISYVSVWFTSVLSFAITYFIGYKPGKSHVEAMAFYAATVLGSPVSGFFVNIFTIILIPIISGIVLDGVAGQVLDQVQSATIPYALATSLASPVAVIISVVVSLFALKFFFNKETVND